MNNLSPRSGDQPNSAYLSLRHQREESPKRTAQLLQWWYQISSPPEPGPSASFQERDLFRRGRTGSQITIFLFLLIFISYPAASAGSNSLLIVILTINLLFLVLALVFNRLKMVTLAGIIVVLGVVLGPTLNIVTTPGGINTSALPIFSFLVLPVMCTVSFLPPVWVFVVVVGNCLFTLFALKFLPSSGELHQVLTVAFPGIVTPIILSQLIVSIVAFLWVRGAQLAIMRADRAEEILKLESDLAMQAEEKVKQREQLGESIHLIETTHVQIANGILSARVPLHKGNILWSVSGQLNNLLSRYQHLHADVQQYQQIGITLQQSLQENARLKSNLRQIREENAQLKQHLNGDRPRPPTI